jgi:NAD-dependent dihydropyrimidine dehydrogenase PreA subunit
MPHSVKIDLQLCTRCQMCADACFVDVIRWDERKGVPFSAYPEDCQTCRVCARVCPAHAIEVIPDWGDRYFPKVLARGRG